MPSPDDKIARVTLRIARALMIYHRYRVVGMEHIPRKGPAILAVSHSLATYDSFLLGAKILEDTGRYPLALGDRRLFDTPGVAQFMRHLGVEEGSPDAGVRLLKEQNLLMLAPGGMRESLRSSRQRYRVSWENRRGFARLAILAQSPVLLAACPAADDIFTVYGNPLTDAVYKNLKWPLPIARGLGITGIPRPVKLQHYISRPLFPPPLRGDVPDEETVKEFHGRLVDTMELLMAKAKP